MKKTHGTRHLEIEKESSQSKKEAVSGVSCNSSIPVAVSNHFNIIDHLLFSQHEIFSLEDNVPLSSVEVTSFLCHVNAKLDIIRKLQIKNLWSHLVFDNNLLIFIGSFLCYFARYDVYKKYFVEGDIESLIFWFDIEDPEGFKSSLERIMHVNEDIPKRKMLVKSLETLSNRIKSNVLIILKRILSNQSDFLDFESHNNLLVTIFQSMSIDKYIGSVPKVDPFERFLDICSLELNEPKSHNNAQLISEVVALYIRNVPGIMDNICFRFSLNVKKFLSSIKRVLQVYWSHDKLKNLTNSINFLSQVDAILVRIIQAWSQFTQITVPTQVTMLIDLWKRIVKDMIGFCVNHGIQPTNTCESSLNAFSDRSASLIDELNHLPSFLKQFKEVFSELQLIYMFLLYSKKLGEWKPKKEIYNIISSGIRRARNILLYLLFQIVFLPYNILDKEISTSLGDSILARDGEIIELVINWTITFINACSCPNLLFEEKFSTVDEISRFLICNDSITENETISAPEVLAKTIRNVVEDDFETIGFFNKIQNLYRKGLVNALSKDLLQAYAAFTPETLDISLNKKQKDLNQKRTLHKPVVKNSSEEVSEMTEQMRFVTEIEPNIPSNDDLVIEKLSRIPGNSEKVENKILDDEKKKTRMMMMKCSSTNFEMFSETLKRNISEMDPLVNLTRPSDLRISKQRRRSIDTKIERKSVCDVNQIGLKSLTEFKACGNTSKCPDYYANNNEYLDIDSDTEFLERYCKSGKYTMSSKVKERLEEDFDEEFAIN